MVVAFQRPVLLTVTALRVAVLRLPVPLHGIPGPALSPSVSRNLQSLSVQLFSLFSLPNSRTRAESWGACPGRRPLHGREC